MDRAYYLRYYEFEKNHWWFRARAEILKEYIRKQCLTVEKASILNVGAATGGSIEWLSQLGAVTSLEYDHECVLFIKDHLKADVVEGSIASLPFAESSFDLVCAFDVVEHVEDDHLAIQELGRVCKKKGSVLITVPANMNLWSQHDVVNRHYRRYTLESLTKLLSDLPKGKIQFISYFNYYFYFPIKLVRKLNNFISGYSKRKNLKSDFEKFRPGLLNEILFSIMAREKKSVSAQKAYAKGVSILAHWGKA